MNYYFWWTAYHSSSFNIPSNINSADLSRYESEEQGIYGYPTNPHGVFKYTTDPGAFQNITKDAWAKYIFANAFAWNKTCGGDLSENSIQANPMEIFTKRLVELDCLSQFYSPL